MSFGTMLTVTFVLFVVICLIQVFSASIIETFSQLKPQWHLAGTHRSNTATKRQEKEDVPPVDMDFQPVVIEVGADKIKSPAVGTLVPQEQIPDAVFASGVLGAGFGVTPSRGIIVAPIDGTISIIAESKQAIGISTDSGLELLIHVGIDTVLMDGNGFTPAVAEGDTIKAGDLLLNFDINKIHKAGYADTVVLILTNADEYNDVKVNI